MTDEFTATIPWYSFIKNSFDCKRHLFLIGYECISERKTFLGTEILKFRKIKRIDPRIKRYNEMMDDLENLQKIYPNKPIDFIYKKYHGIETE